MSVESTTGGPTAVTYPAPTTTGGTDPITTHCSIPSGSTFPLGSSDVVCTGTDAASRTASCVFQVAVTFTPKLKGTRFLAFGDSITGGEIGVPGTFFTDETAVYPSVLIKIMPTRYTSQALSMTKCGRYGETAVEGQDRLRDVLSGGSCGPLIPNGVRILAAGGFDALLLLEGTNDMNQGGSINTVREALRTDIRRAKSAGVLQVFVSTLPPLMNSNGGQVPDMNDAIRGLAASEGAVLVDSYLALGGGSSKLIGLDGIHPTAAGQQIMAQTFFTAIQNNFEVPPGTTLSVTRVRR